MKQIDRELENTVYNDNQKNNLSQIKNKLLLQSAQQEELRIQKQNEILQDRMDKIFDLQLKMKTDRMDKIFDSQLKNQNTKRN